MTDPERLQAAVDEALEFLGRTGTQVAERAQLSKRVVDRGDAKVRKQLGDAIYDLARRCIQVHEKTRAGVVMGPRQIPEVPTLKHSIDQLASRAAVSSADIALADPAPDSSVPLAQARDVLERLEGRTDSWHVLATWEAMSREDWETALSWSRDLARNGSSVKWRWAGTQNATRALVALNRLSEAERLLLESEELHGGTDVLFFNLAYVHGVQGHVAEFERFAATFKSRVRQGSNADSWPERAEEQVEEISQATGLKTGRIRALLFGSEPGDD